MRYLLDELSGRGDVAQNISREHLDEKLQRKLQKLRKRLKARLHDIDSRTLRSQIESLQIPLGADSEDISARAHRVLNGLAQPILEFRTRYFPRATDRRLHKLRIAAKKLRYAMEVFDPVWPGGLVDPIATARVLQDAGGIHQDWAVLKLFLNEEIRRQTAGSRPLLASQMALFLAAAVEKKFELREAILPAVTTLQSTLKSILTLNAES